MPTRLTRTIRPKPFAGKQYDTKPTGAEGLSARLRRDSRGATDKSCCGRSDLAISVTARSGVSARTGRARLPICRPSIFWTLTVHFLDTGVQKLNNWHAPFASFKLKQQSQERYIRTTYFWY
jgi:hypothetical protein